MVRLAFVAINAPETGAEEQHAVETLEAQEARIANCYSHALQLLRDQKKSDAKVRPETHSPFLTRSECGTIPLSSCAFFVRTIK
jgi:hypothetical protein